MCNRVNLWRPTSVERKITVLPTAKKRLLRSDRYLEKQLSSNNLRFQLFCNNFF
jgi:hypothetical protein